MTTQTGAPAIEARGLHKRYGGVHAVAGIDLSVSAGEVVAVLGANGAGKTTLIEMLLGMRRPTAGEALLFGQRPDCAASKARVGAMLQDVDVPQALTVAEIVALVRRYYPRALPTDEVLARADLVAQAGQRANRLSGGQRQRLSFAMALAGAPDILFLDEPTAALDVEARRAFWAQVRTFADDGATVLFASHHMAEVEAAADRVVVVHRGRIIADGTPAYVAASVATRRVDVATDLPPAELAALPGVVATAAADDGRFTLTTTTPEEAVRALFASGARVERLAVADADMETAFLHLIAQGEHTHETRTERVA